MSDRPEFYILNAAGEVTPVDDLRTWGRWFEDNKHRRQIAIDQLADDRVISTVFLGIDHNLLGKGPPLLFETMVFERGEPGDCRRYTTLVEAVDGHHQLVATLLGFVPVKD